MVQSKKSVSTEVSKENVPFQQCDVKNNPIGHLESELDKKIRLHPKISDSATLVTSVKFSLRLSQNWKSCKHETSHALVGN